MNMDEQQSVSTRQPTFGDTPFNWDFDFAFDPVLGGTSEIGAMPMDIEAWTTVCAASLYFTADFSIGIRLMKRFY